MTKPVETLQETETWVFDLDNTLYPASCGLMAAVSTRMTRFVAELLKLAHDEALVEQKRMFREHGTTLRGLMNDHGVDPHDFMDYVHAVDYSMVDANPRLKTTLARLPGRKVVYTNASADHAEKVLAELGVADLFDGIFDVIAAGFVPKPNPQPYAIMAERHGIVPHRAVMLEDMSANLAPAAAMGMTTVWVRHDIENAPDWAAPEAGCDYVHYETDDVLTWLESVLQQA